MSWISDDNLHEGYFSPILVDGAESSGSNAAGPLVMIRDSDGTYTGQDDQRSDDDVVGWLLKCNCTTDDGYTTWTGDRWSRVPTPAQDDPTLGRVYLAPGDSSSDVMERSDIAAVGRARWLSQHVTPHEALGEIRTARMEMSVARQRLDVAARLARAAGQSWAAIGEAAGMSRQSAQERWGSATS